MKMISIKKRNKKMPEQHVINNNLFKTNSRNWKQHDKKKSAAENRKMTILLTFWFVCTLNTLQINLINTK